MAPGPGAPHEVGNRAGDRWEGVAIRNRCGGYQYQTGTFVGVALPRMPWKLHLSV